MLEYNGNWISKSSGGIGFKTCENDMSYLISWQKFYNLNTPVIICPSDITSDNPLVEFSIVSPPGFKVVSTPPSKTIFPFGQTTTVSVQASHSSNIKLSCFFDVTIGLDKLAPKLICPKDIYQKDPIVNFEASATDNDISNPIKITYDKAPNN